ncbi:MAG: hypothetical protein GQ570_06435 [Helicobacteraceae bacterium]|nr:hypothetical protein [Helicobacteraceae bacterium]
MDIIETSIENMGMQSYISTIVIELMQNMMNYSKTDTLNSRAVEATGSIEVIKESEELFYVQSKNIISIDDKIKIEPKLIEIHSLDPDGIKKKYKELRKSGKDKHGKGAGIGFYEIAKLTQSIGYNFKEINKEKYIFEFKAIVVPKKKRTVNNAKG